MIRAPYCTDQGVPVWTWYLMYVVLVLHVLLIQGPEKQAAQKIGREYGLFSITDTIQFHSIPRVLPKYCYLSVHHRWTSKQLEFHTMFAFLESFDEIHVAIGLNTHRLARYGLKWIPNWAFGALDLRDHDTGPHGRKYEAIVKPMVSAMKRGTSCAVIVFPDIAGSTHWGDRSMWLRDGLYVASAYTGVPIFDLLQFEPTPTEPSGPQVFGHIQGPEFVLGPYRPGVSFLDRQKDLDTEEFHAWRQHNDDLIQRWRIYWQQYLLQRVASFEETHEGCWSHEELGTCKRSEEDEIRKNLSRNLRARAFKLVPN